MSRSRKIQLSQWLALMLAWQLAGFLITCYDYFLMNSGHFDPITPHFEFLNNLILNMGGAFVGALLGGSFFVFYVNVKFRDTAYGYSILAVCISYIIIMAAVIMAIGFVWIPQSYGIHVGDATFKEAYWKYLFDSYHLKDVMVWSIVVALTQFLLLMNNKFGHGVLWDIIRGKYHLPRKEMRIFMFTDLNSSTNIAEHLGNERYHELLKDFFADITNPIIDNRGSIYQYIGDEVVVVWNYENGIAGNQCIQCFFDMKKEIEKNRAHYLHKFGLVPGFKAGIHFGNVVVGEIGIMKRDITFSGDVLNTTSRIEGKCKEFDVEVIASDDLLSNLSFSDKFISRHLGNIKLRGKEKEMGLSTLVARSV